MISDKELDYYANLEKRRNRIINSDISDETKETLLKNIELEKRVYELQKKQTELNKKRISILNRLNEKNKEALKNTRILGKSIEEYINFKDFNGIDKYFFLNKYRVFSRN